MGSRGKKKLRIRKDEDDRISRLPDELIHKILSFTDAKEAVQSSVLSRGWKLLWTTLPFLNFGEYKNSLPKNNSKFIRHVLSNRNHQSNLSELNFCVYNNGLCGRLITNFVEYAISHNVQFFNFYLSYKHPPYKLSTFSSNSLKKLTLRVNLEEFALESGCWDLPALTTLHLKYPDFDFFKGTKISDSWVTCLPALRTLGLENWNLSESSFSFSFPDLTTLRLYKCTLPKKVRDLPALISLDLYDVILPYDMTEMFSTLVNLQNLTISSAFTHNHVISCPSQLLNLNVKTSSSRHDNGCGNIVVLAPKLCNFTSFGIFTTIFGVPELENVNIRLQDWFWYESMQFSKKKLYHRLTNMLLGFGNAKTLTFDLESIEVLNEISGLLLCLPSPFCKLKYVKLPRGYKESNMSSALRSYLLGGSLRATIVTTLPQKMLPQTVAVSMADQNAVLQDPLVAPIKELNDSHNIHQTLSVNMNVEEEHVVENSAVDFDRVMHNDAPMERKNKDQARYSMGIEILGYGGATWDVFAYLENQGLDVSWLVNRLNYIEHLRFSKPLIPELHAIDCRIDDAKIKLQELQAGVDDAKIKIQDLQARVDDAKTKLQDVQTLRMKKMTEIEKAFGTMGTNLAVGFIGDYLLPSP